MPLPFSGVVDVESGDNLVYQLQPAGKPMCGALATFLRDEFKSQQRPEDEKDHGFQIHIGDTEVHLFHNASEHYVSFFLFLGNKSSTLVPQIAARFNARLATGHYDTLFTP